MIDLRTTHAADLDTSAADAIRALLWDVFDELTEHDWEHALGGVHVLAWADGELLGHGSVIQRRLLHGGTALRAGYVEAVAVRAEHRRRGVGGAVMAELERVIRAAYDLGALSSSDEGLAFYAARGWQRWQGPTFALTPAGTERTAEDDDSVFVLPVTRPVDLAGELTCDWRDGDVW
ncbi:GNAT family N-acetyltransferase [Saccharomonospora sp. NPDC046836]|uniref:GNAT family N-acetyltransferase n=1 Tax=Saccharomonospora sp. NPDC046836 TaxID=3156921 RepID=UPI0033CD5C4A